MKIRFLYLFLNISLARAKFFINPYPRGIADKYYEVRDDVGEPLILTPFINNGSAKIARNLAQVSITDEIGIKSYSGFFTVDELHNSNQFFWFFPALTNKPDAPVILWLQGGPGGSSLFGLFVENGPIMFENNKLKKREYTWAAEHNLIYIDNPVGTGFSFTDQTGYLRDEETIGAQLYESLQQFFQLFPELRNNKFYITGESYAGKYIPALGYTIHKNNTNKNNTKINMKGLAIGNGLCDPYNQMVYGKYLYQLGLIDLKGLREFYMYENKAKQYIKKGDWIKAFGVFDLLLNGDQTKVKSAFTNITGFTSYYNYLHSNSNYLPSDYIKYLQTRDVRKSIHVGNTPYSDQASNVERYLMEDIMKSVAPYITELLDYYDIVFYNGQLDIIVAYPTTLNFLKSLQFHDAEKYAKANRHIWRVDDEIAGFVKTGGKLTEILVRNAGHMVPLDQPKWALDLITRFTHEKTYH